ncbi:MAG: transposase [Thermodesulfobacteriota bacterium]
MAVEAGIQARGRIHLTLAPAAHRTMRVEHEYERNGAFAYLAAWDVKRAKVFGRCEQTTGIDPFRRLVMQVMDQEPYCSARRVFWVMDNGSSHRGDACRRRLQDEWPNIIVIHTPVHASWLNQVEIFFSVLQRKVLQPNNFATIEQGQEQVLAFERYYEEVARPFEWKFTRRDLDGLLERLAEKERQLVA